MKRLAFESPGGLCEVRVNRVLVSASWTFPRERVPNASRDRRRRRHVVGGPVQRRPSTTGFALYDQPADRGRGRPARMRRPSGCGTSSTTAVGSRPQLPGHKVATQEAAAWIEDEQRMAALTRSESV
jgi:hypothetical protein